MDSPIICDTDDILCTEKPIDQKEIKPKLTLTKKQVHLIYIYFFYFGKLLAGPVSLVSILRLSSI